MKKKQQKAHNPTPWLGLPRPDRKLFTYSENQLLDQITTEIMHAWADDLTLIKRCHSQCKSVLEKNKELHNSISCNMEEIKEEFEDIQSFLKSINFNIRLELLSNNVSKIVGLLEHPVQKPKVSFWKRIFKRNKQSNNRSRGSS